MNRNKAALPISYVPGCLFPEQIISNYLDNSLLVTDNTGGHNLLLSIYTPSDQPQGLGRGSVCSGFIQPRGVPRAS